MAILSFDQKHDSKYRFMGTKMRLDKTNSNFHVKIIMKVTRVLKMGLLTEIPQ